MDNLIVLLTYKRNGLNHFFKESLYLHFQNHYICASTSSIMKSETDSKANSLLYCLKL